MAQDILGKVKHTNTHLVTHLHAGRIFRAPAEFQYRSAILQAGFTRRSRPAQALALLVPARPWRVGEKEQVHSAKVK